MSRYALRYALQLHSLEGQSLVGRSQLQMEGKEQILQILQTDLERCQPTEAIGSLSFSAGMYDQEPDKAWQLNTRTKISEAKSV